MKPDIYLGLVHHPVYNKFRKVVTTSITNLDIHDISRSCLTFGVKSFFIINPIPTQKLMLNRILKFWKSEIANEYNPDRVNALSIINYAESIESSIQQIKKQEEVDPIIITTTAVKQKNHLKFEEYHKLKINKPVLLLFGTGNGLTDQVHNLADYILEPIYGVQNYNHLSVRSAAAIVLDRLYSEK
ncbi:MAG TPA: RNA methyltransferase [Candidatus Cloacimonetes bacterium]|nr:RNA methyltransferase [Candidatus Cloacimonadota bacterium]